MRRFLIVGQTGIGKSSFVNATFGRLAAKTSRFEPCTKFIEEYHYHYTFGNICLIDTPGLSEDTPETDRTYLRLLQQYISRNPIDVTIYITKLTENRFRPDEKRALKQLTDYLGPSIWRHSWIVFTFAYSVPRNQLEDATWRRHDSISAFLRGLTAESALPFSRFIEIIRIDNIEPNWHDKAVPISSILIAD